jgi:hypothetical protein
LVALHATYVRGAGMDEMSLMYGVSVPGWTKLSALALALTLVRGKVVRQSTVRRICRHSVQSGFRSSARQRSTNTDGESGNVIGLEPPSRMRKCVDMRDIHTRPGARIAVLRGGGMGCDGMGASPLYVLHTPYYLWRVWSTEVGRTGQAAD